MEKNHKFLFSKFVKLCDELIVSLIFTAKYNLGKNQKSVFRNSNIVAVCYPKSVHNQAGLKTIFFYFQFQRKPLDTIFTVPMIT